MLDLICFSHLRWDFVFQRPQHLMIRRAREGRVFFVEEPVDDEEAALRIREDTSGVIVVTPALPAALSPKEHAGAIGVLLRTLLAERHCREYIAWYLTPMALACTRELTPAAIVYDCMDELSAFAHAPAGLIEAERELLDRADLVFTGGWSLYEAKRHRHASVHAFPSSVDVPHFARARRAIEEPRDQAYIPRPRLGFFGVVDERLDLALLAGIADARPAWQLVIIGPVAKIDPLGLPRRPNVHWLGARSYRSLPDYIAGWDVALLPFALNDATRFISPTKTPEYLAAGRPVVSTPVHDVVYPYGDRGLVSIAQGVPAFVRAIDEALVEPSTARLAAADAFLANQSWDDTWARMRRLIDDAVAQRRRVAVAS